MSLRVPPLKLNCTSYCTVFTIYYSQRTMFFSVVSDLFSWYVPQSTLVAALDRKLRTHFVVSLFLQFGESFWTESAFNHRPETRGLHVSNDILAKDFFIASRVNTTYRLITAFFSVFLDISKFPNPRTTGIGTFDLRIKNFTMACNIREDPISWYRFSVCRTLRCWWSKGITIIR